MNITALVENTSDGSVKATHGLSFFIETEKHKLLFDLGPDGTIFENAKKLGIDLTEADTVVISHGHYDHGGPLKEFLKLNKTAKVYVQRSAFEPHFSKVLLLKVKIGLDKSVTENPNVILLDGDFRIDDELSLFVSKVKDTFRSEANASLLSENGPDDFRHEQNLFIREKKDVLFTGCAHSGVISILKSVPDSRPAFCIGGFHVYNPAAKKTVSEKQLNELSSSLDDFSDVSFYTCHCTGKKAFEFLSARHPNVKYIHGGDRLEI